MTRPASGAATTWMSAAEAALSIGTDLIDTSRPPAGPDQNRRVEPDDQVRVLVDLGGRRGPPLVPGDRLAVDRVARLRAVGGLVGGLGGERLDEARPERLQVVHVRGHALPPADVPELGAGRGGADLDRVLRADDPGGPLVLLL